MSSFNGSASASPSHEVPASAGDNDVSNDVSNDAGNLTESKFNTDGKTGSSGVSECRDEIILLDLESPGGNSSIPSAIFNYINSIVGAGIIGIPYAIQQCGLVLGIFFMFLVAYLVDRSVVMLIDCGIKTQKYDLEVISQHTMGIRGYFAALIFMFLNAYGAQIAYLVIIADTVPLAAQNLFPGSFLDERHAALLFFATAVVLPISLLRDLSSLSWTSLLSVLSVIVLIMIVGIWAPEASQLQNRHFESSDAGEVNTNLFAGVGTMSFAFVCQHNSFLIYRSLKQPSSESWRTVAHSSVSFSFVVSLAFGLIGFFSFFPYVEGDLLNNFPVSYTSVAVARILLAITMLFTYPMELYVSRHCLAQLMSKWKEHRLLQAHQHQVHEHRGHNHHSQNVGDEGPSIAMVDRFGPSKQMSSILPPHHRVCSSSDEDVGGSGGGSGYGHLEGDHRNKSTNGIEFATVNPMVPNPTRYHNPLERQEEHTASSSTGSRVPPSVSTSAAAADQLSGATGETIISAYWDHISNNDDDAVNVQYKLARDGSPVEHKLHLCSRSGASDVAPVAFVTTEGTHTHTTNTNTVDNIATTDGNGAPVTSFLTHVLLTLALWSTTVGVAFVAEQLGVVTGLAGALASSVLGYVLPPAIYIKTHESRLITACKQARFFGYKPDDPSAAAGTGAALAVSTAISAEEGMSIEHIGGPGARIPGTSVSSTLSTGTTAVAGATTYSSSSTTINSNCNSDRDNATTMLSVSYLNDFVRRCTLLYDFYLPFAMLAFGFVSVIIGVATVLAQAS